MKKLLLTFTLLATSLFAEGLFVGLDTGYSTVSSKVSGLENSIAYDKKATGNSQSITGKFGYHNPSARVFGYITTEKFSGTDVLNNGNAISYGIEVDLLSSNKYFIGGLVGIGSKDFNTGSDRFVEYGLKAGKVFNLTKTTDLEIGVQYKLQEYTTVLGKVLEDPADPESDFITTDSRNINNTNLGIYIGINFTGF